MVNDKNILVTGSEGQLGISLNQISNRYNYNFYFRNKNQLDVTDSVALEKYIKSKNIELIVNCAAFTDVQNAEVNQKLAYDINSEAPKNLANLCLKLNLQLIHISSDFVFDGHKNFPYREDDIANPLNKYGYTKLKGEQNILKYNLNRSLIIRTSWVYSVKKSNFVNKILEKIMIGKPFSVVSDEVGSPTNAIDLAEAILEIIPKIKNKKTEIYHFSNLGTCSRFELALKIKELLKSDVEIKPIETSETHLIRPKYSKLDSKKFINTFDKKIKSWSESLSDYMLNINKTKLNEF